jgi:hypothetical protein
MGRRVGGAAGEEPWGAWRGKQPEAAEEAGRRGGEGRAFEERRRRGADDGGRAWRRRWSVSAMGGWVGRWIGVLEIEWLWLLGCSLGQSVR